MSTTDTRAAFEAHYRKECGMPDDVAIQWDTPYIAAAWDGWQSALTWQAATEAAKAAGTAGKQPLLPEAHDVKGPHGWLEYYTADQMREYGQACAEGARHDPDAATRLRLVCKLVGIESHVPADDETLWGAAFAVLGQVRAALEAARQPAPVLSDEQIDHIARSYFAEEYAQMHVKNAIHDALAGARVLRPDHRETLEQIAHFLHNSVRIQQNAPDDYYPATEFDSQLQQAADEIGGILAATNRSQP